MKKIFISAGIISFLAMSTTMALANNNEIKKQMDLKRPCPCQKGQPPKMSRPLIDERLNLTEAQKKQAHELRMKGHEKIKPVFAKIQDTKQKIVKVNSSDLKQEDKDVLLNTLNEELKTYLAEAKQIRMENAKEFESILTDEQKTEFEKIKKEGRAKAQQYKKDPPKKPSKK